MNVSVNDCLSHCDGQEEGFNPALTLWLLGSPSAVLQQHWKKWCSWRSTKEPGFKPIYINDYSAYFQLTVLLIKYCKNKWLFFYIVEEEENEMKEIHWAPPQETVINCMNCFQLMLWSLLYWSTQHCSKRYCTVLRLHCSNFCPPCEHWAVGVSSEEFILNKNKALLPLLGSRLESNPRPCTWQETVVPLGFSNPQLLCFTLLTFLYFV